MRRERSGVACFAEAGGRGSVFVISFQLSQITGKEPEDPSFMQLPNGNTFCCDKAPSRKYGTDMGAQQEFEDETRT